MKASTLVCQAPTTRLIKKLSAQYGHIHHTPMLVSRFTFSSLLEWFGKLIKALSAAHPGVLFDNINECGNHISNEACGKKNLKLREDLLV